MLQPSCSIVTNERPQLGRVGDHVDLRDAAAAISLRPSVQLVVAHSHPAHAALLASGFTTNDVETVMAGDRSLTD